MSLALSIQAPERATPGVATRASVSVRNTGHQVRAIKLSTIGVDGSWIVLENDLVKLFPNEQEEVALVIEPPRGPAVVSGRHDFAIHARAVDDPNDQATDEAGVEVAPWTAVTTSLGSTRTRSWRRPVAKLAVLNGGNVPIAVRLVGGDDNDLIYADISPTTLLVGPGQRAVARVRLEHAPGSEGALPYWVRVLDKQDEVLDTAHATLTIRRKLPWGRVIAGLAALAVLAFAAVALGLFKGTEQSAVKEVPLTAPDSSLPPASAPLASDAPVTSAPAVSAALDAPAPTEPASAAAAAAAAPPAPAGGQAAAAPAAPQGAPAAAAPGQAPTTTLAAQRPPVPASGTAQQVPAGQAAPQAVSPEAPRTLTITPGDGAVHVAWEAPANLGAAGVDHYTLVWSSDGAVVGSLDVPGTEQDVTPLENGRAYVFEVSATPVAGPPGPAAASEPVIPSGLPGAPVPSVGNLGNTVATISWAPVDGNGSDVVDYSVSVNGQPGLSAGTNTNLTLTGLTRATPYTVVVIATNANGGTPSGGVTFTTTNVTNPIDPCVLRPTLCNLEIGPLQVFEPVPDPDPIPPFVIDDPHVVDPSPVFQNTPTFQVSPNLQLNNIQVPRVGP